MGTAMQRVKHEDVLAPHADKGAGLVFPIGELPLLQCVKLDMHLGRYGSTQTIRPLKREQTHDNLPAYGRADAARRGMALA